MIGISNKNRPSAKKIFLRNYQLYLLGLPAILATLIFSYGPMYGIQIAFKDYKISEGIWGSAWLGLEHFERFIQFPNLWMMVRNTLALTLYSLALFPIPIILALLLNELRSQKFKKTVQMISYAPHFLSVVVVCGMVQLFLARGNGIVNNLTALLGGTRIDFLGSPSAFAHIYVWSGVWQGAGWGTIIYLAALAGVSPELIEAARIDGASRLQIIRHINVPTILPAIVIMFILSTGNLLNVGFEKVLLLQNDLNRPASTVIQTYVYQIGITNYQYGYSAAIGLLNNLVNVMMVLLVNKVAKKVTEVGIW